MSPTPFISARSLEVIEADFDDLLGSPLTVARAREEFERLWDEVNSVASQIVSTSNVVPCLALLQRMQQVFETRYADQALARPC
jgi:hypothetical protein